jgi:hypothetical protein
MANLTNPLKPWDWLQQWQPGLRRIFDRRIGATADTLTLNPLNRNQLRLARRLAFLRVRPPIVISTELAEMLDDIRAEDNPRWRRHLLEDEVHWNKILCRDFREDGRRLAQCATETRTYVAEKIRRDNFRENGPRLAQCATETRTYVAEKIRREATKLRQKLRQCAIRTWQHGGVKAGQRFSFEVKGYLLDLAAGRTSRERVVLTAEDLAAGELDDDWACLVGRTMIFGDLTVRTVPSGAAAAKEPSVTSSATVAPATAAVRRHRCDETRPSIEQAARALWTKDGIFVRPHKPFKQLGAEIERHLQWDPGKCDPRTLNRAFKDIIASQPPDRM